MLVFYIIKRIISSIVSLTLLIMLIDAVLSFINIRENRFISVIRAVTRVVTAPVRTFLYRMRWGQGMPIDMAFLITYIILMIIRAFLR